MNADPNSNKYIRITAALLLLFVNVYSQDTEELFPVQVNNLWGYIDENGKIVIDPQYDKAYDFMQCSRAIVFNNGKCGLIDKRGQHVISLQFDNIQVLNDHFISVKNSHWGIANMQGKFILPCEYDALEAVNKNIIYFSGNNKCGFADSSGEIYSYIYKIKYSALKNNYVLITTKDKQGLLDRNGKIILFPEYDSIVFLSDYLIATFKDMLFGFHDLQNNTIASPKWHELKLLTKNSEFEQHENFIKVKEGNYYGLYDTKNNCMVIKPGYDDLTYFSAQFIKTSLNNLTGLIAYTGKSIMEPEYDEIKLSGFDNCFLVGKQGLWGIAGINNKQVIEIKYDTIYYFGTATDKPPLFLVQNKILYGVIDLTGKTILPPAFHKIEFSDNLFLLNIGLLWGLADINGKILLDCSFDKIGNFENNVAIVRKSKYYGVINITGNEIAKPEYDNCIKYNNIIKLYKKDSIIILKLNNYGKIIDKDIYKNVKLITINDRKDGERNFNAGFWNTGGSNAINIRRSAQAENNIRWFYSEELKKWGLFDYLNNRIVLAPLFDDIRPDINFNLTVVIQKCEPFEFYIDTFCFSANGLYGLVNHKLGIIVLPAEYVTVNIDKYQKKSHIVRIIDRNGKFGYLNENGNIITGKITYTGNHNGSTGVYFGGKLKITDKFNPDVV
ncbi:MAG: WG repeat-containing protein, partial [Bacteroidia bacterium]|nr:WG repeat-containing protein [Bacteroidia bacterium]